jgi:cell division GTPase FtsZ
VNILLLSTGGGGGNILRSVKAWFERDVATTQQTDPAHADRLRAAVSTCFLDTNEFSLLDVPAAERLLIGARTTGRLGARHDPDVARQALEESRSDVEALIGRHSVIVVIGTGGKGTGAGTIFPLAQMARQRKKLVLPIFVLPSFERHEVDKRRYDHALAVSRQFDAANIRLVEILNDRGYDEGDPQPQTVVWERMNAPIARALRGLLYVLWDLSQVDPSDLSALFAGPGRLRIGFGGIDPSGTQDPTDEQVQQAVRDCWANPYSAFSRPAGTSLVCIQGEWSNVADARIKGGLAASARASAGAPSYNPLYTRVSRAPRPWGVTAVFGEYTGAHPPIEIEWPLERSVVHIPDAGPAAAFSSPRVAHDDASRVNLDETPAAPAAATAPASDSPLAIVEETAPAVPFATLGEFAVAVNRSETAALTIAANGATAAIAVEGLEVRKLLGTIWFRTVVPRLSQAWRTRILDALVATVVVPNHVVRIGRQPLRLSELTYPQLHEVATKSSVVDDVRPDLDLLVTVGRLWGGEAVARLRFSEEAPERESSRFAGLLGSFRS